MQKITNTQTRLKIPHTVKYGAGSLCRRVNLQAFFIWLKGQKGGGMEKENEGDPEVYGIKRTPEAQESIYLG